MQGINLRAAVCSQLWQVGSVRLSEPATEDVGKVVRHLSSGSVACTTEVPLRTQSSCKWLSFLGQRSDHNASHPNESAVWWRF